MNDDVFESQDALDEAIAAEWRNLLEVEWSRPFVALTAAAYFIASNGKPIDSEDKALEEAAMEIIARLQDGKLQAFGKRGDDDAFQPISRDEISSATLDGSPFFDPSPLDASLHLSWAVLPGGDDDRIEGRSAVRWQTVSIRRADLAGLLSQAIAEPAGGRGEAMASVPAIGAGESHKRQRGPLPKKLDQTVAAMLADLENGFPVVGAVEKELSERYGVSRDTCRKARKMALSELVEVETPTNDK